ncbi:MAG: hypothetical protein ABMB14_10090 [Myxococcota bacterium]
MIAMLSTLMSTLMLTMTDASADQCAWIPKATAEAAVKYLDRGATWASYCEPCDDPAPAVHTAGAPAQIRATSAPDLWEVVVDGQPIDLAYVYVVRKPTDTKLGNLAFLVDCPTTGVGKTIPRPPER